MSIKYKDLEGSVPVNGDITPITRQKIPQLDSTTWGQMNATQLWEQRELLTNRIAQVPSSHPSMAAQLQRGLVQLDVLIQIQHDKTGDMNLI